MSRYLAFYERFQNAFRERHLSDDVRVLQRQPVSRHIQCRPPKPSPCLVAPYLDTTSTTWVVLQYRRFVWEALTEPAEGIVPGQQAYAMSARQLLVRIPDLTPLQQHGMICQPEERTQIEPLCHSDREGNVLAGRNEALPSDCCGFEKIALFAKRRELGELYQIRAVCIVDVGMHGAHVYRLQFVQSPALDGAELVFVGDTRKVEQLETDRLGGHRTLQLMWSVMDTGLMTPLNPKGRKCTYSAYNAHKRDRNSSAVSP